MGFAENNVMGTLLVLLIPHRLRVTRKTTLWLLLIDKRHARLH